MRPVSSSAIKKEKQPLQLQKFLIQDTRFCYLYKVIGVPYFRNSAYLGNIYETLEDWINNDDEEEDYRDSQKAEMEMLKTAGDNLFTYINVAYNSQQLQELLRQFENSTNFDSEIFNACNEFLQLSIQYPSRSVKQNLNTILFTEAEPEYVYIEQYISFYWSGNDELCECLFDMVNNELNEMGEMEEPMSLQIFDEPHQERVCDFDFETRLFEAINNLTEQLNFYDEKFNEPVQ